MVSRRIVLRLLLLAVLWLGGSLAPGLPAVRAQQNQIPQAEYEALVALYNATDGPNWTYKWTLPTSDPCGLYGITCENGHVTGLWLDDNNLNGTIPPELGNLSGLLDFLLSNNQLRGTIPPELGNLSNLRALYLNNNQLSGTIPPELGNLSNLQDLLLSSNHLSGFIPPELGNLGRLHVLYLRDNRLSGTIPPELGNLGVEYLSLENNLLSGAIPPELGNLGARSISLKDNQLSGSIPPELGNLAWTESLYLDDNRLSGTIPPELGNMVRLRRLHLENNQLSGAIPPELGDLGELHSLDLHNNQLSGAVPAEFGRLVELQYLDLHNNQLSGAIPPDFGNLTKLQELALGNNRLSGVIPPEFGNLADLRDLDISYNALRGPVPATITSLTLLWVPLGDSHHPIVDLGYNQLWTDDPTVQAFLNTRVPGWSSTQQVAVRIVSSSMDGTLQMSSQQGGRVSAYIPYGAVTEATTVVCYPLDAPGAALPSGYEFGGLAFDLVAYRHGEELGSLAFSKPVDLMLAYPDGQVARLVEETLTLYLRDNGAWVDAATTCTPASSYVRNPDTNTLRLDICHLSSFALAGQRQSWPWELSLPLVLRAHQP